MCSFFYVLFTANEKGGTDFDDLSKKATGVSESNLALPNQYSELKKYLNRSRFVFC